MATLVTKYVDGKCGLYEKISGRLIKDGFVNRKEAQVWLEQEMMKQDKNPSLYRITEKDACGSGEKVATIFLLEMFEFGKWKYGGYFNTRESAEAIADIYLKNRANPAWKNESE